MAKYEEAGRSAVAGDGGDENRRLLSLDVFRGLTILAMILVNNPGTWEPGARFWPLDHAKWHGWTPTDLIFPFFLFIVGTSLAYSLRKYCDGAAVAPAVYGRIIRRTIVLFLLGMFLNATGRIIGTFSGTTEPFSFETLRWLGVLQRIALVYFIVSLVVLHAAMRRQVALAALLLLGYWSLLAWLPTRDNYEANLSPDGNVVRLVDLALIGKAHMYTQATTEKTEPEGILSTFPAVVTSLLGYWAGLLIQRRGVNLRTVAGLVACGVVLTALGLVWGEAFPVNKKLWTSSFVLLTGGLGTIALSGCLLLFDVWGWRRLARPFEIVGVNAIFVYTASGVVANLIGNTTVGGITTKQWIYERAFTSWITEPKLASLAFAATTVTFWWIVLWAMARRGWSIRV